MASPAVCPVCNEAAVIVDTSREEECSVCAECGTVVEEHVFTSKTPVWINEGYQHVSDLHKNAPKHLKHIHAAVEPEGLVKGRKRAKQIAGRFMSNSEMVSAAVSFYEKAYYNPDFKHILVSNKIILSDCCVFIVGRQNYSELPLTMKEFCLLTHQSIYEFAAIYKQLLTTYDIKLPHQSMGCVIGYYMSKAKFQRETMDLVTDIVSLCQENLLKSSSHRDILVMVASYIAWTSQNLTENKGKVLSLKQFMSKFNFTYSKSVSTRLKEVTDVLTKVGQNLPWAAQENKKHFVQYNLKDILKYKRSLMYEQILQRDSEEEDLSLCELSGSNTTAMCQNGGKSLKRSADSYHRDTDEEGESVKRSKVTRELNKDDSEDSDTEILAREVDENISEYIRSDDDVQRLLKEGFLS